MKKIVYFLLFFPLIIMAQDSQPDPSQEVDAYFLQEIENQEPVRIETTKPNSIWTKPLIIDASNHDYDNVSIIKLEENVIYNPDKNYNYPWIYRNYPAAIIVNKDNMTIDLNGFNLSLDPAASSNFMVNSATYGISIYQGVKNLRIISSSKKNRKGSITNFSGYAIFGSGSTQSYNSYDLYSNRIKNLLIDNLLITQNINGIYLENALNPTITNTNIIYNYSPRFVYGIYFSNILNGLIDGCNISQNWSYTNVYGIYAQDTVNLVVQNCQANTNRSLKTGDAIGFMLTASGLALFESSANIIKNCVANRNLCAFVENRKSVGFHINNFSHYNVVTDCVSFLNDHTTTWGAATPPSTPPDGIGFLLDSTNFNQLSHNQSGYNPTSGFRDTGLISTSFFTANTALFNLSNYDIIVPNPSAAPGPLDVLPLYANQVTSFTGAGPQLQNLSIQAS